MRLNSHAHYIGLLYGASEACRLAPNMVVQPGCIMNLMAHDYSAIGQRHRDEADFLWELRDVVIQAHGQNLESIQRLDDRLDAHLDGIQLAADPHLWIGPPQAMERSPAMAFIGAVVGASSRDFELLAALLEMTTKVPRTRRALIAGLGWVPRSLAYPFIKGFLNISARDQRCFAILGICAAHRIDPGPLLAYALDSDDDELVARAMRAVGELGRYDLLRNLQSKFASTKDQMVKFEAAWSLALFNHAFAARELFAIAHDGGPMAERATELAARSLAPGEALSLIKSLGKDQRSIRASIWGAAALGDPALIDSLIERMAELPYSRLAGWAFSEIVGVDLNRVGLAGDVPSELARGPNDEPAHSDVRLDSDVALPFPVAERVAAYFNARRGEFPPGKRISWGQMVSPESALAVLIHGHQPARRGAALELALRGPMLLRDSEDRSVSGLRGPLFPIRAPARRQRQLLAKIRSAHGGNLVGDS